MYDDTSLTLNTSECTLVIKWLDHYIEHQSRGGVGFSLFPDERQLELKLNQFDENNTYVRKEVEMIKTWMSASFFSKYLSNPTIFGDEKQLYKKINKFLGILSVTETPMQFSDWNIVYAQPQKKSFWRRKIRSVFS